jgi:hypothetical protein
MRVSSIVMIGSLERRGRIVCDLDVENADDQRVDDATSASQLEAEMSEDVDAADEFDEGITREPFDEDGVEP